jgi:hypothetical protein
MVVTLTVLLLLWGYWPVQQGQHGAAAGQPTIV